MTRKLLVADDSLTIQKVIRLALSNEGYHIQTLSDGRNALAHLTSFRPDVVLIDVSLPGQNAFEVKREINQHPDLKGIPFVLMSSVFEKVDEKQASEVFFQGRLSKPFDPAHLREVLGQLSQSHPSSSPPPPPLEPTSDKTLAPPRKAWTEPPLPVRPPPDSPLPPPLPTDLPLEISTEILWEEPPSSSKSDISPSSTSPPPSLEDLLLPEEIETQEVSSAKLETDLEKDIEKDIEELTQSTLELAHQTESEWTLHEPSLAHQETPPLSFETKEPSPSPPTKPPTPSMPSLSPAELEHLIRQEVVKHLPDLAEKVIRQEIHRLLSES